MCSVTFSAESPLPIPVITGGGSTPHPALRPSVFSALFVQLLHQYEGKHADLAIACYCSGREDLYFQITV